MKASLLLKTFNKLVWKVVHKMPTHLRRELLRSRVSFNIKEEHSDKLTFEVATTKESLEESFKLVQDSYKQVKITNNIDDIYRITKFHCLPTTRVFVAKYDRKIIATLTVILDSSFKLPIDQFTSVDYLRKTGRRICEFSSLAVHKDWRKRGNGVFIPFSIYVLKFCRLNFGIDDVVMVTKSSARFFYSDLYLFKGLEEKIRNATYVNNKPSFSQVLNLCAVERKLKLSYQNRSGDNNLYHVWREIPFKHICQFNENKGKIVSKYLFTQEIFLDFFKNKNNILGNLTDKEKLALKNYYKGLSNQLNFLDELHLRDIGTERLSQRYYVNFKIYSDDNKIISAGKTVNVSRRGLSAILYKEYQIGESIKLSVCSKNHYTFRANICWKRGVRYGLAINFEKLENKRRWKQFINEITDTSYYNYNQLNENKTEYR